MQPKKPTWEEPQYSGKKIYRAGRTLATTTPVSQEYKEALLVLNNWRSAHAYPLHVITTTLKHQNPDVLIAQRLKRLDSIVGKIERFPTMNLYKMQDIGGCRLIADSIDEVYNSLNKYKNSRVRHKLVRETDYILNPKESGYRSVHLVYQFHSDKKETYVYRNSIPDTIATHMGDCRRNDGNLYKKQSKIKSRRQRYSSIFYSCFFYFCNTGKSTSMSKHIIFPK